MGIESCILHGKKYHNSIRGKDTSMEYQVIVREDTTIRFYRVAVSQFFTFTGVLMQKPVLNYHTREYTVYTN